VTNAEAVGYMILAAKKADLDEDTIRDLETRMISAMDIFTEDEADEAYRNF
jgi:hypothetical protein